MRTRLLAVIALLLWGIVLCAQDTFEVMSVKPNVSADGPSDPKISPQRFAWVNATLRQLVQVAYEVRPYQLVALPEWADTARYDVSATASFAASPQQMRVMLQHLLAERFELVAHHDRRELPVYSLVLSRRDGRLGPGMKQASVDCESITAKPVDSTTAQADYAGCIPQMGLTRFKASGYRPSGLASALMRVADRPVIDKSGLTGTFDIELTWTPDPMMLPPGAPAPSSTPGSSLFTSLEEQLGLKLVSDHGPVDVLVIDRINRPKPD
jgi:uncharacterized protein (TIGR03435 family)